MTDGHLEAKLSTRRQVLGGVGAAVIATLAGCATEPPQAGTGDSGSEDDTKHGPGTEVPGGNGNTPVGFQVLHVPGDRTGANWDYRTRVGFCTFVPDPADAGWLLDLEDPTVVAFLDETDLEADALLYVESVGPNTCFNALEITDLNIESDAIVGTVRVVDTSEPDHDVCGPSLTYPGALIRIVTDPLPETARITITNGWGDRETVMPADGPAGTVEHPDGDGNA